MDYILFLIAGLALGLLFGGFKITIIHKHEQPEQKTQEYNKSMVDLLPNEVKQYYHSTGGQNRF